MKKAIVLGASGLIGNAVLNILLQDSRYDLVKSIGRSELKLQHKKLVQIVGNLFEMNQFEHVFEGVDDLYIAIGTTKAKTSDNAMYEKIDAGIPIAAAKLAQKVGVNNLVVVSSMGANAQSKIFYSRIKGKMEDSILNLHIQNINIVRPSLLLGERNEKRLGERLGAFVMKNLSFIIPKKHKPILGSDVAKAMVELANEENAQQVWLNHELQTLADKTG